MMTLALLHMSVSENGWPSLCGHAYEGLPYSFCLISVEQINTYMAANYCQ